MATKKSTSGNVPATKAGSPSQGGASNIQKPSSATASKSVEKGANPPSPGGSPVGVGAKPPVIIKEPDAGEQFAMKNTPGAPLFSQDSRRRSAKANAFGVNRLKAQAAQDKKKANSNSTNSYYISETPTAPDEKELTRCAAKAIGVLIEAGKARTTNTPPPARAPGAKEPRELIFDERAHPLKSTLKKGYPSDDEIFKYLRVIYKKTRMQPECIVMTVSYIEKVLANQSIVMNAYTWRRISLAALIVADKVFEDYAVWNADFLSLFPQSSIQDLNALEREFLNFMGFMTTFKASDYAKFYFALKELSDHKEVLPSKPLTQEQAERLELGSKNLGAKSKREEQLAAAGYSEVQQVSGMDLAVSIDRSSKRAPPSSNEV